MTPCVETAVSKVAKLTEQTNSLSGVFCRCADICTPTETVNLQPLLLLYTLLPMGTRELLPLLSESR